MKLFNINIDFKTIQKIFKLIIILLLVFYCIYILYFSSNLAEGFANCSNCQMKPNSGDCISIYDFSYGLQDNGQELDQGGISFELIDTSYVFCPWEANCGGPDDYKANMVDQDTSRLGISNEDFEYNKGLNNITCCSGEPFYDNNTTSYINAYNSVANKFSFTNRCDVFNGVFFSTIFPTNNELKDLNFTNAANMNYIINTDGLNEINKTKINKLYNNTNFNKIRTFCTNHNSINLTNDFSGMLFKKNSVSKNILLDPDLTFQEIFDYQNTLEISYNTVNRNGIEIRERLQKITYNSRTFTIDQINDQIRELNTNPNQNKSTHGYTKLELQTMLSGFFVSTISYEDISYIPVNTSLLPITNVNNPINNQYLLNEDQFFNCFGDVKDLCANNTDIGSTFQQNIRQDIQNSINYFGVSDETIKTASELTSNNYGPKNDLEWN